MEIHPDFRELLELLNKHGVEYLIAGGYALAFHGAPRFTGDLDILVKPLPANAERVVAALSDFGFGSLGLTKADFCAIGKVVQLGVPPVRVDFITSLTGISIADAFAGKVDGSYGGIRVHFLGRREFVANKKATGRKTDLADLEALGEK
ncbi:MAG: hypothetical protein V2A71_08840 [Candidatus Eisenbacteria bacterium]